MTDPDDKDIPMGEHINPLQFCQASSTDFSTFVSNGGGACVQGLEPYNSGNGLFVADLYDCVPVAQSMENVKQVFQGVYDVHPSADGICCPNRGNEESQLPETIPLHSCSIHLHPAKTGSGWRRCSTCRNQATLVVQRSDGHL